ncbi:flagellar hook protein FlgK [Pontibacillus halophilus JSM 076056 = DSM 19796]|uniref:Flagellar hook-associated protein 1 n=1 Tax=Pontibacillus halophilus JSM 076056 = DSM 19796 TaxID=1385510 RepID=A0A0A5GPP9_9BACI|nr:flagellar hook-associated protein FlgK [Pontibacillus halophilus]KGX93949.1 flagellar hook protein FlgK [Pontibacillus halophilus JSM 076056 = DSM 19796]
MSSTFHGLEVAKRGVYAQQSALYTVSHNISNANTPGYSRQRVNMETMNPYPPASMNKPEIPGQIGQGVKAGSVERVRDSFLDVQYRGQNSQVGYYEELSSSMDKMERIMNEPSEEGLSKTMDQFWQSLQDLAVNPEDTGARSVVRQRGLALADTFNYLSDSLKSVQSDIKNEINVSTQEINSYLSQINSLNQKIADVEPHGMLPNDLYDQRDLLVDELTKLVNVDVSYSSNGGRSLDQAEGALTLKLADDSGNTLQSGGKDVVLLDGASNEYAQLNVSVTDDTATGNAIKHSYVGQDGIAVSNLGKSGTHTFATPQATLSGDEFTSPGKLRGSIDSMGYMSSAAGGSTVNGVYTDMLQDLDKLANELVTEFNAVHSAGKKLDGTDGGDFFSLTTAGEAGAAGNIEVHADIKTDTANIAASINGNAGDGSNANALADVNSTTIGNLNGSVKTFYESMIGTMAVQSQEAQRMQSNSETLRMSADEQRQSVSAVSLDEEMTNMIKYQHAYNAAARNLTTIDEMLDKIINGMGRVGR